MTDENKQTAEDIKNSMREAVENDETGDDKTVADEVNAEIEETQKTLQGVSDDDVLKKAQEWGYKEGATDKDGNTFSPMEFLSRKPLFNRIHSLQDQHKKDMDDMRKQLNDQRNDNKKIAEYMTKENDKLLADLKQERETALTDLDVDKVRQLDKEIEEVKVAPDVGDYSEQNWNDGYFNFVSDNEWYGQDSALTSAADIIGKEYRTKNQTASPKELYEYVVEEVKKRLPARFETKKDTNTRQQKVTSANKRTTTSQSNSKKVTLSDFDHEEQRVIQNMARATGKKVEDYLANF